MTTPLDLKQAVLVDDDAVSRNILCGYLNSLGYNVIQFPNLDSAWQLHKLNQVDLLITDFYLGSGKADTYVKSLQLSDEVDFPIVIVSASEINLLDVFGNEDKLYFYRKPINVEFKDFILNLEKKAP